MRSATEPESEAVGSRPRSTAPALALLSLASALLTALLAGRAWFVSDDFWNLAEARQRGWGWSLLGRPVFGHVIPGSSLLIGLVAGRGPAPYGWAVVSTVAFGAAIPVVAAWACRQVGASPRRAVLAAALVSTAAPLATASTWWSASVTIHPPLLSGMVVLGAVERGRRGARWGFPVAAVALFVGMSCGEGAVVFLIPPAVLWIADLPGPIRSRLAALWAQRRRWWPIGFALLATAVVRASATGPLDRAPVASGVEIAAFPISFVVRGFVPSLVGLVSARTDLLGRPGLTALVGVVVGSAGLVAVTRSIGTRAVAPLLAVLITVVARGLFVAVGRLGLLGWGAAVEGRYLADLVWLVPVLLIGRWPANRRGRPTRADRLLPIGLGAAAVLGLVGQVAVAERAPSRDARRYRDRLERSWADLDRGSAGDGALAVVDSTVPYLVIGPEFGDLTLLGRSVGPGIAGLRFGPADRYVAPDASGRLQPVRVGPVAQLEVGRAFTAAGAPVVRRVDGCWEAAAEGATVWLPLSRPVLPGPWLLDLRLGRGRSDRDIRFVAAGRAPSRYVGTTPTGRTGRHWLVASTPFEASQIGIELAPGRRFCLRAGSVALAVPIR